MTQSEKDDRSSVLGISWTLPYVLLEHNLSKNYQINQMILILPKFQQYNKLLSKFTWNSKGPRITKTLLKKMGSSTGLCQD